MSKPEDTEALGYTSEMLDGMKQWIEYGAPQAPIKLVGKTNEGMTQSNPSVRPEGATHQDENAPTD